MNYENLRKFFNELTDIVYRERIVVFGLIAFSIISKLGFQYLENANARSIDLPVIEVKSNTSFHSTNGIESKSYSTKELSPSEIHLAKFNPATASHEELMPLGFSGKTAHILINYREKGGRFYKKEDVKKIYGVSPELYQSIEPYIILEGNSKFASNGYSKYEKKAPSIIDINTASEADWESLPGIGKFYSQKIVNFRTSLGGFLSIDQLKDCYGIQDTTFQKMKPFLRISSVKIKKLNINTASLEQLDAHPFIAKWQAEEIIKHRPIYGINDLYELYTFKNKEKNKRVEPYLEF